MNISFFSTSKVVHFSKFVFVQSFLFNSIDGEIFNDSASTNGPGTFNFSLDAISALSSLFNAA